MHLSEHDHAVCPACGEPLWYGVKEESSGWKVFYVCESASGCGREFATGRIRLSTVDHRDEVYARAETMTP